MGIEEIVFCACQGERDIFHVYMCVCVVAPGAVLDKGRRRILYFGVVAIVVLFDPVIKSRKNINISPSTSSYS